MHKKVIILAGGKGERLWPYSRSDKPKQFLTVFGETTLLQQAADRARKLVGVENIYVITVKEHVELVRNQIPDLHERNIIAEPIGRNTAPSIGLSYTWLKDDTEDTVMLVLPADHLVMNEHRFCEIAEKAVKLAFITKKLVTIGIKPTRPETEYGYIKSGKEIKIEESIEFYEALKFTEKPDIKTAVLFLQSGNYLWNSGIFAWRLDVIKSAYRQFLPRIYLKLNELYKLIRTEFEQDKLNEVFPNLPVISVDYGILEKSRDVLVIPGDFGWDDLGNWLALERVDQHDINGNAVKGDVLLVDTKDSVVHQNKKDKLTVIVGLEKSVVVDTEDVLLVSNKTHITELRELVNLIKGKGLERYLMYSGNPKGEPAAVENDISKDKVLIELIRDALINNTKNVKIVKKPWGKETWWSITEDYVGKLIEVGAGHSLSLQYHREKREIMLFLSGSGIMELNNKQLQIKSGLIVDILPGMIHRVNAGTDTLLLEISTPQTDDVVRLKDSYGRT